MVVYEAARAMVNLNNVTARELQPAVSGKKTAHKIYGRPLNFYHFCFSFADVFDVGQADSSFCCRQDTQPSMYINSPQ